MNAHMDNVRLRIKIATWAMTGALIALSMLLAWLMIGCALVEQRTGEGLSHEGYIKGGIWPRHFPIQW